MESTFLAIAVLACVPGNSACTADGHRDRAQASFPQAQVILIASFSAPAASPSGAAHSFGYVAAAEPRPSWLRPRQTAVELAATPEVVDARRAWREALANSPLGRAVSARFVAGGARVTLRPSLHQDWQGISLRADW